MEDQGTIVQGSLTADSSSGLSPVCQSVRTMVQNKIEEQCNEPIYRQAGVVVSTVFARVC